MSSKAVGGSYRCPLVRDSPDQILHFIFIVLKLTRSLRLALIVLAAVPAYSEHNRRGDGFIVPGSASHKGKAGIAEIVEHPRRHRYCACAIAAITLVLFHPPGITLFPRVLRATNHYRVGIAPEKQKRAAWRGIWRKIHLLQRAVKPTGRRAQMSRRIA